jgi:uncharacterized protein YqgC (DUF456 family)
VGGVSPTDTQTLVTVLCGCAIVVGIVGVVLPVVPGLLLCWAGVLVWALFADRGFGRWVVLGAATLVLLAGTVAKYLLPGRNLKRAGVPNTTLLAGGVLGLVGFFAVPVVGLFLGFALGVWLAELARLHDSRLAWPSTKHALKAAGVSILIEMAAGFAIAAAWVAGLVFA